MPTHEILHAGDASDDYFCSLVMLCNGHPPTLNIQTETVDRVVCDGYPTFIAVKACVDQRKYGASSVGVYRFVLMDGSNCLIKAATDSNLSRYLKDVEIAVGSSIIVLDHLMLWVKCDTPLRWRSVMVIKKMNFHPPPDKNEESVGFLVPRGHTKIEQEMIERCDGGGNVVFSTYAQSTVKECPEGEIRLGKWIIGDELQFDWQYFCKRCVEDNQERNDDSTVSSLETPNQSSKKECECCTEFGFPSCILTEHPTSKLQKDDLFNAVKRKFLKDGETGVDSWRKLSSSHKRWCIYWWYAVNVFEIGSCASPLPACLVDHVRQRYPNENGSKAFTGFKTSAERAKHKLVKRS